MIVSLHALPLFQANLYAGVGDGDGRKLTNSKSVERDVLGFMGCSFYGSTQVEKFKDRTIASAV